MQLGAVLTLTDALPVDTIYEIVTSPSAAEDAALAAIEQGDLGRLALVLAAAPNIASAPVTGPLTQAVLAAAGGHTTDVDDLVARAARSATHVQRRANAIRLRGLASRRPDLPSVADLAETHRVLGLVRDWIETATRTQAQDFYLAHSADLTSESVADVLAGSDDPADRQHLAILTLASDLPAEQVFAIAGDTAVAERHAMRALEAADLSLLSAVATANAAVLEVPASGALFLAVLLLADGEHAEAREYAQVAAHEADSDVREAHARRLRRLAEQLPDLAEAAQLAEIIDSPSEGV